MRIYILTFIINMAYKLSNISYLGSVHCHKTLLASLRDRAHHYQRIINCVHMFVGVCGKYGDERTRSRYMSNRSAIYAVLMGLAIIMVVDTKKKTQL